MVELVFNIFRSFFMLTLCLLILMLPFSIIYSRSAGALGLLLGWSGMLVYLFLLAKSMGQIIETKNLAKEESLAKEENSPEKKYAPVLNIKSRPQKATFFRVLFLVLFLTLGAGKGMVTFIWTVSAALVVYFLWIIFLIYRFYTKT